MATKNSQTKKKVPTAKTKKVKTPSVLADPIKSIDEWESRINEQHNKYNIVELSNPVDLASMLAKKVVANIRQ